MGPSNRSIVCVAKEIDRNWVISLVRKLDVRIFGSKTFQAFFFASVQFYIRQRDFGKYKKWNDPLQLTQCMVKSWFHRAGPNERAGFMLAPVYGPRIVPIAVIANPNLTGIESCIWAFRGSHTPPTIRMRIVVEMYSIATAWNGDNAGCGAVTHNAGPVAPTGANTSAGVTTINSP